MSFKSRVILLLGALFIPIIMLACWWLMPRSEPAQEVKEDAIEEVRRDERCVGVSNPYKDYYGLGGREVNYKLALDCALNGHAFGYGVLIMAYANGQGVDRDLSEAIQYAKEDPDTAPYAKNSRIKSLTDLKEACEQDPKGERCQRVYHYFSNSTSGRAMSFKKQLNLWFREREVEAELRAELSQLNGDATCLRPATPSIDRFRYRYARLGDDQLKLTRPGKELTLTVKGIDAVLDELKEQKELPGELVYLDEHPHKALFPYTPPIISIEGSGSFLNTHLNWYALDGYIGRSYALLLTNTLGQLVYFWDLGGQYGDSVVSVNLKTAQSKVIGDRSYLPGGLFQTSDTPEARVDIPLDLGYERSELKVIELQAGIALQLKPSQTLLRTVDPSSDALGVCQLKED